MIHCKSSGFGKASLDEDRPVGAILIRTLDEGAVAAAAIIHPEDKPFVGHIESKYSCISL